MKIANISFSRPYIKFDSIVNHFTSRKSIIMEWIILELLIHKYDEKYNEKSLKEIIENFLCIPDSDLLVKESLIELFNMKAIETDDIFINENISLNDIKLSQIKISETGRKLQSEGLLPGEDGNERVSFLSDVLENKLELFNDNKLDKTPKGIKLVDFDKDDDLENDLDDEYDYNDDFDDDDFDDENNSNEEDELENDDNSKIIFDYNRAKEIIESYKDKNKFPWLQATSEIKDIKRGIYTILWKNFNNEINLLENGKIELKDRKEDQNINKIVIENINKIFTNNYDFKLNDFNYSKFSNLLNIYTLDKINEQLKKILKNKDYIIINKKLYKDEIKTDANLVLVYGDDSFNIDINNKKIYISMNEDMPLENCIALNKDKTNINIANFNVYNDFGNGNIVLGYAVNNNHSNLTSIIKEIINKYQERDKRILLINLFIGGVDEFRNNMLEIFNSKEDFNEAFEFLYDITEQAKQINIKDDNIEKIINYILSYNKKANSIKNINTLIEYLKEIYSKVNNNNNIISKLYISIIKKNNIISSNLSDTNNLFNFLNELKINIKDIESIAKNLYKNAFIEMIKKYISDTKYRFPKLSLAEDAINSIANNIKSIEENLKLNYGYIYDNNSSIENIKQINSINGNVKNNLDNIDRKIKDISNKLGIEESSIRNIIINDKLKTIRNKLQNNISDNSSKNKKNKKR
ncbi:hypothetical protein [Brachyspira sp. SAP_772]|uniref:hypothetical protein n=1 Tax=Brachyspira sp. SAP_772 TaxID=2608385 RepID=UPI0012F495E9|nr:hypothetical protein [Brachyspira sp. SAP_772]